VTAKPRAYDVVGPWVNGISMGQQDAGRLPDFVIIGAMKCGTTSLHGMLDRHSEIFMSREKELVFFYRESRWRRGPDWYRAQFRSTARLCGESSPPYTVGPPGNPAPQRMFGLIPDARLIYVVRDPVERTLAHYKHQLSETGDARPLAEAILHQRYVFPSRYRLHIDRFLAAGYAAEQIHVVQSEALRARRAEVLAGIAGFLGVAYEPAMAEARDRHLTDGRRVPTPFGLRVKDWSKPGIKRLPPGVRPGVQKLVLWPFSKPMPKLHLPDEVRARLAEELRADADGLRAFTGQSFPGWSV